MDAAPPPTPPELRPQSAFFAKAHDYAERQLFWELFKIFSLNDRTALREQGLARRTECLQQLQRTGMCEQFNIKSANGEITLDVKLDRNCVLLEMRGAAQKKLEVGLPPEISALLPKPNASTKSLTCKPYELPQPSDSVVPLGRYEKISYHFG